MKTQTDDRSRTDIKPTDSYPWALLARHTLGLFGLLTILGFVIPGCLDSAMSFSPDGEHLAMVVCEQIDDAGVGVKGGASYRLMVLSKRKKLKVLEDARESMLSAPVFSPDGKRLCYLRLPLPTEQEKAKQQAAAEKRADRLAELAKIAPDPWTRVFADPQDPGGRKGDPDMQITDQTLPSVAHLANMLHDRFVANHVVAKLVVRNAKTGKVIASVDVKMPFAGGIADFHLITLRYGPRGKWIYVSTGHSVLRVHPVLAECHILAAPALVAELSPDGNTLAVATGRAIGFVATDGSAARYVKWPTPITMRSIAWADNKTLAILSHRPGDDEDGDIRTLNFLPAAGGKLETVDLKTDANGDSLKSGVLAVSPNGRHVVASYSENLFFLNRAGKELKHITVKSIAFASPTFSPDSKVVAVKRMAKVGDNSWRADEIVFFSPAGARRAAQKIPPVKPIRGPASKPAD